LEKAEIPNEKLPTLMHSHDKAGVILPQIADELSLPKDAVVLCGGNDAVLAGFSAGLKEPGEAIDIAGTCEIIAACLDHPVGSRNYNIRCHVLPDRWVTFFVLNTGGKALEWFHSVFCRDMSSDDFYEAFVPQTIEHFLEQSDFDEDSIPEYSPYLQGSRYSLDNLTADFSNLNLETNREKMLLGLLRGNLQYIGGHLKEVSEFIKLKNRIITTGGGARIRGMNLLKKLWMGDFEYEYQDESSLLGAAMLGKMYLDGL
jgi:sugar (pentulose or hexulose) kinase